MPTRLALLAFAIVLSAAGPTLAESYPSRPITMIVPWPAGGPTDTIARIVSERMRLSLGQPIIIENIAGAGGTIGVARVARAAPDGYTLIIGDWNSHVLSGAAYTISYDLLTDFAPVGLLASNPQLLLTKKEIPAKNLKTLIAWLKTNENKVTVGTGGPGSASHVCGLYLQNAIGARFQFVPYRGGAPLMQDLMTGQIDLVCQQASNSLALVRAGQIKAHAVAAGARLAAAPHIPTVDEAGLPGLHVAVWSGLWLPAGASTDVVARLHAAVTDSLADPNVRDRLIDLGLEIATRERQTPEALLEFHASEIKKWWPMVKAANIKID